MKKEIESYWRDKLTIRSFNRSDLDNKFYVLSMFPYPSGFLHMGHVRVYTISDTIARFYRMNGKNVFHPMGWDAFGLPAENAAIQRKIPADQWTKQNIEHMKRQLTQLGCSFDWNAELATCSPDYYKWTQKLFLMMFADRLAYQREATVNWDPVDKTVLAEEQIDANGCSWRSGARVEKKLLRQWFVKTTKFAESLYNGLDDPVLQDWRDITNLQKHWIGPCDGWSFNLKVGKSDVITIWTKSPEHFIRAGFIAIKRDHILNKRKVTEGVLDVMVRNPFGADLPLIVVGEDVVDFPAAHDCYVGIPTKNGDDLALAEKWNLRVETLPLDDEEEFAEERQWVLDKAIDLGVGGDFKVSSNLKDWLISRQRFWGTPIPIIHCASCGAVPVRDEDLPIKLPDCEIGTPLAEHHEWLKCSCPKCGGDAKRESDTMDTFVDSSWYFLRYLSANDNKQLVDMEMSRRMMPVDVYIGGKEHAVLHLYYARFINHFLHGKGFVSHPEPFKRLLVQGMVMGRTYRVKGSGKYLNESEVDQIDEKGGRAIEKSTGKPVVVMWEKMSKSKFNGVDPEEMIEAHGCDTTRLIMLADVAPTSHRNWSEATFPGIINWQKRLWLTLHDFAQKRARAGEFEKSANFDEQERSLDEALNQCSSSVTFNYKYTHQLSVAISRMQSFTNAIRRATADVEVLGANYERALASQIIMLAPMAPHFASELWSRFRSIPNRIDEHSSHINWSDDVFNQKWPRVDKDFPVNFCIKANNVVIHESEIKCGELNEMSEEQALFRSLNTQAAVKYLTGRKVLGTDWRIHENYQGTLTFNIDRTAEIEKQKELNKSKQKKKEKRKN